MNRRIAGCLVVSTLHASCTSFGPIPRAMEIPPAEDFLAQDVVVQSEPSSNDTSLVAEPSNDTAIGTASPMPTSEVPPDPEAPPDSEPLPSREPMGTSTHSDPPSYAAPEPTDPSPRSDRMTPQRK